MRLLPLVLLLFCLAAPAAAHSLRVFATVEGDQVTGYGFFVGGGRPQGMAWTATMAGQPMAQGLTNGEGGFTFAVPAEITGPLIVTINAGDGHVATRTLEPERFGAPPSPLPDSETDAPPPHPPAERPTDDIVRSAVAHEIAPLLARIEEMDARMRLTDLVAGLCLIFGIAGIALWVRGLRL
jgi:nickel transport protein